MFHRERIQATLTSVMGLTLAGAASAQCPNDDVYEDNDTCGSAAVLPAGPQVTGLVIHGPANPTGVDHDYWIVQSVPAGQVVTVDVQFVNNFGDIDITLYDDPACMQPLSTGQTVSDVETVSAANASGASRDFYLEVSTFGEFDCNDYEVHVSYAPDPCQQAGLEDGFEENDDCGSAAVITTGVLQGLFASQADPDYFRISVPAGELLTIFQTYTAPEMGIAIYSDAQCTQLESVAWFGSGVNQVLYSNGGPGAVDVYVHSFLLQSGCGVYDLIVSSAPDPCQASQDDTFEPNDSCGANSLLPQGTNSNLYVSLASPDYYRVDVGPDRIVTIDQTYPLIGGTELGIEMFGDPGCTNVLDGAALGSGLNRVSWTNETGVSAAVYLRAFIVSGTGNNCDTYQLDVSVVSDPCAAAVDDAFEPNDDCASSSVLGLGSHSNLWVGGTDDDFYTVSVPPGEILVVDQSHASVPGLELGMELYPDAVCAATEAGASAGGGSNRMQWANTTGVQATVKVRCFVFSSEVVTCSSYDLQLSTMPDPCQDPLADDAFEGNDDCASATPVLDGFDESGLFASVVDEDYYSFELLDGGTVTVSLHHVSANGAFDLELYDESHVMNGVCGDGMSFLTESNLLLDDKTLMWTNSTGSSVTYYLRVFTWDDMANPHCNDYDLQFDIVDPDPATPFCFGDGSGAPCPCGNESPLGAEQGCEWSGGIGAVLSAAGTSGVASDDLVLTVTGARPNQPSLLVQGASTIAVPFKDGLLCTGTPTERVEFVFLDGTGSGSTAGSIVSGGNVSPGDVRYYQQWFRDPGGVSPCGTGSNFTQGLIVSWM